MVDFPILPNDQRVELPRRFEDFSDGLVGETTELVLKHQGALWLNDFEKVPETELKGEWLHLFQSHGTLGEKEVNSLVNKIVGFKRLTRNTIPIKDEEIRKGMNQEVQPSKSRCPPIH